MVNSLEILLGEGLEQIKFGMTMSQVKKILGEPDETEKYQFSEDESDITEAWHYDAYGFSLSFDQENDWLVGSIAVSQTPCKLHDIDIMDMAKEKLLETLISMEIKDLEVEEAVEVDDDFVMEIVYSPEENICFFLESNKVSEVKWSPRWADTEILEWPTEN